MITSSRLRKRCPRLSAPRSAWSAAVILLVAGALLPAPVVAEHWAAPRTVFVPRTGHTVDGLFLDVWREQRVALGDPITEELRNEPGSDAESAAERIVQYFENAALVYVPDAPVGEQVQTLELGRDALDRAIAERPAAALLQATRRTACGDGDEDTCRGFAQAGHTVRGNVRVFWEEHGGDRWLGQPLTEAYRVPDGSWLQYFERGALRQRSGAEVAPLPVGSAIADQLDLATERIVRPNDVPVYAASLFTAPPEPEPAVAPEAELIAEPEEEPEAEPAMEPLPSPDLSLAAFGPGPQQGGYKEIVVSISAQTLWAYEGDQLVNSTLVSTGTAEVPETTTPVGSWQILTKYDVQDMEGTISDEYYFVEDVPDVMYFDNLGNALHGTYWHSNFGTPMSHGCVNLPLHVAAWMYDWAPIGTAVTVIP